MMEDLVVLLIIGATILLFVYIFWKVLKKMAINSLTGVILLVLLKLVFCVNIPINGFTVIAVALFGIPAVGTLLILHLGGL